MKTVAQCFEMNFIKVQLLKFHILPSLIPDVDYLGIEYSPTLLDRCVAAIVFH